MKNKSLCVMGILERHREGCQLPGKQSCNLQRQIFGVENVKYLCCCCEFLLVLKVFVLLIFSCSPSTAGPWLSLWWLWLQGLCSFCPPLNSSLGAALSTNQNWGVVAGPSLGEEGQCWRFGACESQNWAEPGSDCTSQCQPDSWDE